MTPFPLQDENLPSVFLAALSKCTTMQKLCMRGHLAGIPPSVTAALLRAMSTMKPLEDVSLHGCTFSTYMYDVDEYVCAYMCASVHACMSGEGLQCMHVSGYTVCAGIHGFCNTVCLPEMMALARGSSIYNASNSNSLTNEKFQQTCILKYISIIMLCITTYRLGRAI